MDRPLAADPGVRAELQAARAWGVSWHRFNGWEPATTTTYTYDTASRVMSTTTRREPEWDDLDREAALSLMDWEAGLCTGCRHPLEETTAPEREGRYRAGPAVRCHRCTAAETAAEMYRDSPAPGALMIPVEELS